LHHPFPLERLPPHPNPFPPGQIATEWLCALRGYLAVIAAGNLIWEFLHMPLYTIWFTGTWAEIVFAALHCTGGDILIALSTLMLALILAGDRAWPIQGFRRVAVLTVLFGVGYTIFSEWLNIVVRAAWAYSDFMPVVPLFGTETGFSPLLQWIVIPLLAFHWARRRTVVQPTMSGAMT